MPEPATDRLAEPVDRVTPATDPAAPDPAARPAAESEPIETSATRKLGAIGWFSILWLGGITLAAILAPWLPLPDPDRSYLEIVRIGPIQPVPINPIRGVAGAT